MSDVTQLLAPVAVFTGFVVILAVVVIAARAWLVPSEPVTLTINSRQQVTVAPGGKLLWALAGEGIYLPAACGGRGSCGQCTVHVLEGGGPPLPNEAAHIGRRDIARGVRLACMVPLNTDLEIRVADDLLEAKKWRCKVASNRSVAPYLRELVFELPAGQRLEFDAGDYVLVEAPRHRVAFRDFDLPPEFREEWRRVGLLDLESSTDEPVVRAYSLANPPQRDNIAMLVVRIAPPPPDAPPDAPPGRVSSYLFSLKVGDDIDVSGPFGEFHAIDTDREMILIAGGAGLAPIRAIVLDQLARGTQRRMSFWYGARDAQDICYADEFDALAETHPNFTWRAALSSPKPGSVWQGAVGFIHNVVFEEYLHTHPAPDTAEYYLCGPPLMSAAVIDMLDGLGVDRADIHLDDFGS